MHRLSLKQNNQMKKKNEFYMHGKSFSNFNKASNHFGGVDTKMMRRHCKVKEIVGQKDAKWQSREEEK